jgi:hypothetical protein
MLITLRGQLASRIKNTEGRQPRRINTIPNRSPDLGIPSRTDALWPSFRPFCHPIQHTGARYTPEARAPVFRCLVYGNLDLIPIGNRTSCLSFIFNLTISYPAYCGSLFSISPPVFPLSAPCPLRVTCDNVPILSVLYDTIIIFFPATSNIVRI